MNTTQKITEYLKSTPYGCSQMTRPILKEIGITYFEFLDSLLNNMSEFEIDSSGKGTNHAIILRLKEAEGQTQEAEN